MTVTAQALQEIQGKNDWRDESSNVSSKQILTTPTWRSAAECSTVRQQWPEKLYRRWLKDECVGQAMLTKQSADADGLKVPDDWWNFSASYDADVWCRHLYSVAYTRTTSLNSIPSDTVSQCSCVRSGIMPSYLDAENTSRAADSPSTASASYYGRGYRRALHYRSTTTTGRETTPEQPA